MNGAKLVRQTVVAALMFGGLSGTAHAQGLERVYMTGGLAIVGADGSDSGSPGFNLGAGFRLNRYVSAVGEVTRVMGRNSSESWTDSSVLAGLRISSARTSGIIPFGQFLVGRWNTKTDFSYGGFSGLSGCGCSGLALSEGYSESFAMWQAGGGVDVMVARRIGLRVGAGIERVGDYQPSVKTTIGVVVGLGR